MKQSEQERFRQVALERLSSPEEIDNLLSVTTIKGWITLAGAMVLIATAAVWSVLGELPTKLEAQQCILLKGGTVNVVTSAVSGRLSDLAVEAGDQVARGQVIGRINQIELLQKIKLQEQNLKRVSAQYQQTVLLARQSRQLRAASWQQQHQFMLAQLEAATKKSRLLAARVVQQTRLVEQGLLTQQTLIATGLEQTASELEAKTVQAQLKQLEVARLEAERQSENELHAAKNRMEEVQYNLTLLQQESRQSTQLVSPYIGRVVELKAAEGQLLERGDAVLSIESAAGTRHEMEAYIYLPTADGKKVKAGMAVEISPTTTRREEYGFLPAQITSVADYPSTDQGLMRVFGNEKVVQQLIGNAPPLQILAALKPASGNASQLTWSTRQGPPFPIQNGTLCSARITVNAQQPITLVLPVLRKTFGLD